jgi:hypothetical protein
MRSLPRLVIAVCVHSVAGCSEPATDSGPEPIVTALTARDHVTHLSDVPGSYEWWNFYAESASGDVSLSVIFLSANLFDAHYRRDVRAWQASPGESSAPRPSDAWLLQLNLTIDGKKVFTNIRQWPGVTAEFSPTEPRGRIGDSSFEAVEQGGQTVFRIVLDAPDMTNSQRLQGQLELRAGAPGFRVTRGMYDGIPGGGKHHWELPLGLPLTNGTVRVVARDGSVTVPEQPIVGRGYTDHMWGEGLLGDVLSSWHFGTVDLGMEGKLVYVWLTSNEGPSHGFSFFVVPGQLPITRRLLGLTPFEQREGAMGLTFDARYALALEEGGRVDVTFDDALGEDWPFQVSGETGVDIAIPGVIERVGARGVGEYLLQSGIDSEAYEKAFDLVDQMDWNP